VLLAACGGGGNDAGTTPPPIDCSVAGQQDWLRGYFKGSATSEPNYFWYGLSPNPSPAGFTSVDAYFDALIYGGGDLIPNGGGARWPSDRYSGFQTTESFNRFFGAGRTLGYGVAVAGLEVTEPTPQPTQPLYVRYVEPLSPTANAGVVRGDRVMSINGRATADVISDPSPDRFSALTPSLAGDQLTLVLRNALGAERPVTLRAAEFTLTPVQDAKIVLSPEWRVDRLCAGQGHD